MIAERAPVAITLAMAAVLAATHGPPRAAFFSAYRDGAELAAFGDALARTYPGLVRARAIGTSGEGRPIRALDVGRGGAIGVVIDGTHHAREWLSAMVPACIADRLARGDRAGDPHVRAVLDAVHFTIVPVVNPDGYAYTWTTDRSWRKNRRGGYGVDLNRNYSVGWGTAGSSASTRSPNYRGAEPFSEPETRAMRALVDGDPSIAAHVDFHTFSQVIVYPWSHRRDDPPDRDAFAAIADRMSAAMAAATGEHYAVRAGADLKLGAGGTAGDWTYGEHGALAFLVELRPRNMQDGGFDPPPEQIVPACDEGLAAVLAVADGAIARAAAPRPPGR